MLRKTVFLGVAALAASTALTLTGGESSLARAAGIDNQPAVALPGESPVETRFVTKEVVQPLPAEDDVKALADGDSKASSLRQLVSRVSDDRQVLSKNLQCLAGAVYFESRGEPLAGQLAVAQVIVNRAASGQFPSSYCGVVRQPAQFSFVRHGRIPTVRKHSAAWRRAKAIARIAHEGLWDSKAADALYFHAKYVSPRWSSRHQAMATINSHIFYR
ncbi:cell wall hydrolase [Porphyrobacter algicida]|uniref:Cell wall hydrolase n=1 Tax=Qipengyuania algicida TaxID=1836209 RepID=A0A845ACQ8_9SPHN|nr:cell wall hydrolase [Qipengyuania algicida]MXP28040.1 cell wall hydrolase [Qipengyuania algicida]